MICKKTKQNNDSNTIIDVPQLFNGIALDFAVA